MLKKNKSKIIISSLVILGAVLILFGSLGTKSDTKNSYEKYTAELEEKIENFLEEVDGIKNADVIITLEAYDESQSASPSIFNSASNENTQTTVPKVRGVAVACTNGDDYEVQVKITEIISKYLGISSNRIKIVALS